MIDVVGDGGGVAVFVTLKQEKFRLSTDVHSVAHFFGYGQALFQGDARASDKRSAVGKMNITDDTGSGNTVFVAPWQDNKGVKVWL